MSANQDSMPRTHTLSEDLALALKLADIADEITLTRYQALDLVIETKPDSTPVTDADKAVEAAIRKELSLLRPLDSIVGEEFGSDKSGTNFYWVIDPIDGTKNFLRGVPTWATLIGLVGPDGVVIAGVVSAPALSRRWFASTGGGAFVSFNGSQKAIGTSAVANLNDASISYSDLVGWGERRGKFIDLQEKVWRTRGHGDFWSHMLVAEGAVDLAVEPQLSLWDMAALEIIVKEAGGSFTDINGVPGSHGGSAISTNGLLLEQFLKAIN